MMMKVGNCCIANYSIPVFFTLEDLKKFSVKFYIEPREKFIILENLILSLQDSNPTTEVKTPFKILYNGKVCYAWFVNEKSQYYAQYKISKL